MELYVKSFPGEDLKTDLYASSPWHAADGLATRRWATASVAEHGWKQYETWNNKG